MHDVKVKRGADATSDHHLVVAVLKIKLKAYKDQAARPSHKYNVHSLKVKSEAENFKIKLKNQLKNIGTALERSGQQPAKQFWPRKPENTKNGFQQTPGHSSLRGGT